MSKMTFTNRLLYGFAKSMLGIFGWQVQGELPDLPKYVVISTHTSGWDYVLALLVMSVLSHGFFEFKFSWMGKKELFRGPLGAFFKWTGGIPIERSSRHHVVEQIIQAFHDHERLVVGITPEGTRKKAKHWKTGFYYIAHGAQVPIVCGFIDYERKVGGIGPIIIPSGDIQADMKIMQDFYRESVSAKYPDRVGDIKVSSRNETGEK